MKSKTGMALMGLGIGVGSAALYTNIKNGNMKKLVRKMNSAKTKAISDLENMMQEEKIFLFLFLYFFDIIQQEDRYGKREKRKSNVGTIIMIIVIVLLSLFVYLLATKRIDFNNKNDDLVEDNTNIDNNKNNNDKNDKTISKEEAITISKEKMPGYDQFG